MAVQGAARPWDRDASAQDDDGTADDLRWAQELGCPGGRCLNFTFWPYARRMRVDQGVAENVAVEVGGEALSAGISTPPSTRRCRS